MDLVYEVVPTNDEKPSMVYLRDEKAGRVARVPLEAATRHWLLTTGNASLSPEQPRYMVLAYAFGSEELPQQPLLVVSESSKARLEWPTWHPSPERIPQWIPIPRAQWIRLPTSKDSSLACADILACQVKSQRLTEQDRDRQIQNRCEQIVKEGEADDAMNTLEYYTKVRVKGAYLQMNAEGLAERLRTVRRALDAYASQLVFWKGSDWEQTFKPAELAFTGDLVSEDPNALCCPQEDDYDPSLYYGGRLCDASHGAHEP